MILFFTAEQTFELPSDRKVFKFCFSSKGLLCFLFETCLNLFLTSLHSSSNQFENVVSWLSFYY